MYDEFGGNTDWAITIDTLLPILEAHFAEPVTVKIAERTPSADYKTIKVSCSACQNSWIATYHKCFQPLVSHASKYLEECAILSECYHIKRREIVAKIKELLEKEG